MSEGLSTAGGSPEATVGPSLIPELEAHRAGFRWARREIRDLTAQIDEETYNRRPARDAWSAAECVEHLSVTAREMLPALDAGIRQARERGWLAHGPFEYGRLGDWFVGYAVADELPPKKRAKAPKLYRPPHRRYELEPSVEEFVRLQDELVDRLQLASGVDLARVKVKSPAMSLVKLSLGQWFRLLEGHQRRHLWQASESVRQVST
jgi:hypothetical protein